jgi:hypothetical protein
MRYPSIKDIAAEALREVAAEAQVKTAEQQVLRGALTPPPPPRTELSTELHKLASECRRQSDDITYADLEDFFNAR